MLLCVEESRQCVDCKSNTTRLDNRGSYLWYKVNDYLGNTTGFRCALCYDHYRRKFTFQNFKEKRSQRLCSNCGGKTLTTTTKTGYPHERWYKDGKGGWYCSKCRGVLLVDRDKKHIENQRRMMFKNKIICLKENPRKGICEWCHKKIGDEYIDSHKKVVKIKRTQIHHIQYRDENPLKTTVELCASCHRKETIRISKKWVKVIK